MKRRGSILPRSKLEVSPPRPKEHPLCSAEDWEIWRENPVTKLVMEIFAEAAEAQKAAWTARSWTSGSANPLELVELRTRADAYLALPQMTYPAFVKRLEAMEK